VPPQRKCRPGRSTPCSALCALLQKGVVDSVLYSSVELIPIRVIMLFTSLAKRDSVNPLLLLLAESFVNRKRQQNIQYSNIKLTTTTLSNRIKACQWHLFVKLKYQSNTIILFVGVRYSMRHLLSDLNNYSSQTSDMRQIR